MANLKKILKELENRDSQQNFNVRNVLFKQQYDFVEDASKFKVATCSRRAGKSVACATDLYKTALETPNINCLYITLNRLSAKRIIWREMIRLNKEYNLGATLNETELTATLPTGSTIYISGAKDKTEIEKFRGMALKLNYIDEAQSFKPYLKELIEDVLVPATYDYNGQIVLIGTPGPILAGPFHDAYHGIGDMKGYSKHHWTMQDNPYIKIKSGLEPEEILRRERERKGIDETNPTYMRESLGLWVKDTDALVYRFQPDKGYYDVLPAGHDWEYVIGVDLGWHDADAIAVLAFSRRLPTLYLVHEDISPKQTYEDLAAKLTRLRDKYSPIKIVGDTGGIGKKIVESINTRYHLKIEAAEKTRKIEFIELINDDLRTARLQVPHSAKVVEDWMMLQWDYDSSREKPKISDGFHSDIADAVLYAWREAKHYTYEPPVNIPQVGTPEWMIKQEEEMESKLIQSIEDKENEEFQVDINNWDNWE